MTKRYLLFLHTANYHYFQKSDYGIDNGEIRNLGIL
jgi:hypothetical protein